MPRLAVLAEIGAPVVADGRPWGLRRSDLAALSAVREELHGRRVIVVVGPPGPGGDVESAAPRASAVATGLAAVSAAAGIRTALVECDLGHPRLAAELGLEPLPGLHEYLRWEATPDEVLQTVVPAGAEVDGGAAWLACVCAGRPSESPRTLLGLGSFRHLKAKLREAYELTILLAASAEGTGGAAELVAAGADYSIAALAGKPGRRGARATSEALSRLGARDFGAVVVADAAGAQRS